MNDFFASFFFFPSLLISHRIFFFFFLLSYSCFHYLEVACGIHVRFQIRDVPGPKIASLNDFETFALNATTIVFILDVTVCYIYKCISSSFLINI